MLAPHPSPRPPAAAQPISPPIAETVRVRRDGALDGSTAERLHVVVAAVHGRFRPLITSGRVVAGTVLGHITGGGRSEEVRAATSLDVQGLLARPGHLVAPGQALVWAQVEGAA